IADLKGGKLDWVDQVPFEAINVVKRTKGIVLDDVPGFETTNITWNSNPRKTKNRELLDPRVKRALSMCVDRNRVISVVFSGYAKAGVKVTQKVGGDSTASYAVETGSKCDASKSVGYTGYDIAMWDWIGYIDPDFMLSVVTKDQWCSWSDTGWDNPAYDRLYEQQGSTVDPQARQQIVDQMQQMVYDQFLYTQLVNEVYIDAHTKRWTGIETNLNAYSKKYYTAPS